MDRSLNTTVTRITVRESEKREKNLSVRNKKCEIRYLQNLKIFCEWAVTAKPCRLQSVIYPIHGNGQMNTKVVIIAIRSRKIM